jgi:membrane protein implicated in regulation of membrane protease activity
VEALALVLLTVAVGLAVLEAAIPGLGLAGAGATVAGLAAAAIVWQSEVVWWPLVAVGAATVLWTLMVGGPRPPTWAQVAAPALHAAGGVAYGVIAEDVASIAVGVVGAMALAAGFAPLHAWTRKLVEQQPTTGMEALVGRTAVVQTGAEGRPVVRIDGSLWSIGSAPGPAGTPVVVRGWRGFVLDVEPAAHRPEVPSPPS